MAGVGTLDSGSMALRSCMKLSIVLTLGGIVRFVREGMRCHYARATRNDIGWNLSRVSARSLGFYTDEDGCRPVYARIYGGLLMGRYAGWVGVLEVVCVASSAFDTSGSGFGGCQGIVVTRVHERGE